MVVENGGDAGIPQPLQTFLLQAVSGQQYEGGDTQAYKAAESTLGVEFSLFHEGLNDPVAKLRRT